MESNIFRYLLAILCAAFFISCSSGHRKMNTSDPAYNRIVTTLTYLSKAGEKFKFTDPEKERKYAKQVMCLANRITDFHWMCVGYNMMGTSFTDSYIDSAYYYYRASLVLAQKNRLENDAADALYSIGWLNMSVYNYKNAIIFYDSCIRIAETTRNYRLLSTVYNSLATVKIELKDRAGSIEAFQASYRNARISANHVLEASAISNLSQFETDTLKKLALLNRSLQILLRHSAGAEQELASIYLYLANAQSNPDSAFHYLDAALKIVANTGEVVIKASINNALAYVYLDKGYIRKAEECLIKVSIPQLEKIKNYDWLTTLYDSYGDVLKASGKFEEAVKWKEKSVIAKNKADQKTANEQVRLLSSLLDLKNKEREIMVQHERVQKVTFILIIAGLFIVVLIISFFWMIQRSRARFQKQQFLSARRFIELEENEKDRTARDLHDITGKFILNISNAIENVDFPEEQTRDELIEKVEDVGYSLRQISHRLNKTMVEKLGFDELIYGYCEDFNKLSGLPIEVEMPKNEYDLPGEIVLHVYRITQELLSNASKYAKDGMVVLTIKVDDRKLELSYRDTGPGVVVEESTGNGMGFMNIYERVKLLGGKAKLVSSPGNGLEWEILIPYFNKIQKAS